MPNRHQQRVRSFLANDPDRLHDQKSYEGQGTPTIALRGVIYCVNDVPASAETCRLEHNSRMLVFQGTCRKECAALADDAWIKNHRR